MLFTEIVYSQIHGAMNSILRYFVVLNEHILVFLHDKVI